MSKGTSVALDASTASLLSGAEHSFSSLCERIGRRFGRVEVRRHAFAYMKSLLTVLPRKNSWQVAEEAGETTPYGIQRVLNGAHWSAEAVRDDLRAYVLEHLGAAQGILVLDETGFLKKGTKSAGVQRQYSGTAGRIENCQIGVFLAYTSHKGRAFVDRELYLPKVWTEDRERCEEAGVPEAAKFGTKPELARRMLERAFGAGVKAAWVTADEAYGQDRKLRVWLEELHQPFVLCIPCNEPLWSTGSQRRADVMAQETESADWTRMSAGDGAKGPRLYDWARRSLARFAQPGFEHWLLIRRGIRRPDEVAYYVVFAPSGASLETLVKVAGSRWAIEECFEGAKQWVGLDQYEVRKYEAWYRYVTLSILAHAFLAVLSARAGEKGGSGT